MALTKTYSSPFGRAAFNLVANGYHPLPILPGNKIPGQFSEGRWKPMQGWTIWRDQRPEPFILNLWAGWEQGGIGVVLGSRVTSTHELGAIDYDTDDLALREMMESALPPSTVHKRGRRGYTAFYLLPTGTKGRKWKRGAQVVCELLTGNATRQTVIPPSIHPQTGEPYRWETAATLENTRPQDLVALTDDDLERFTDTLAQLCKLEESEDRIVSTADPDGEGTPFRRLNDLALANLDAWVPVLNLAKLKRTATGFVAVAHWRPSTSGRRLEDRDPNLGISSNGIRDFGTDQRYTPLDLIMAANNWDLDQAFRSLCDRLKIEAESFDPGVMIPADLIVAQDRPGTTRTAEGDLIDAETGEVLEAAPAPSAAAGDADEGEQLPAIEGELPDHLTKVPGLVGEITEWIVATARQPNRVLALGAAISVIGTLIGRRLAGPTLSGTHLYIIGLAPSGSGKDHPLRQIDVLMKAANAGHLIGPDDFMSMTAVVGILQRQPLVVCPMDEFGAFLGRLSHRRASAHEKGITKILRSTWGASFRSIRTPEWGSRKSEEIHSPALSIYGISTAEEFFKALAGDDVINGFLNRFLLLATETKARAQDRRQDPLNVPTSLGKKLTDLYMRTNQVTAEQKADPFSGLPAPRKMEADKGAERAIAELVDEVDRITRNATLEPFFARTSEMAIRLATIRAAGRGAPALHEADVAWGRDLALWSARKMAASAGEHMAENDYAEAGNKVVRLVRRQGKMRKREILKYLKGMRSRELDEVLGTLVEAGRLQAARPHSDAPLGSAGGRPPSALIYSVPQH